MSDEHEDEKTILPGISDSFWGWLATVPMRVILMLVAIPIGLIAVVFGIWAGAYAMWALAFSAYREKDKEETDG